jgi:hypothetical protein
LALSAQTGTPGKGRQVVDQAIAALGGERFLHMHSRVASGRIYSFFHDEMNGYDVTTIYTEYLDNKPSKGLWCASASCLARSRTTRICFLKIRGST